MPWIYLIIAGLTEIIWAIGLKLAEGFTNIGPSILTAIFIILTFLLFAKALDRIPIGTAYAAFTGIGAAGTAVAGMVLFGENAGIEKISFICLLIIGVIGLKMTEGKEVMKKESNL